MLWEGGLLVVFAGVCYVGFSSLSHPAKLRGEHEKELRMFCLASLDDLLEESNLLHVSRASSKES